MPADATAEPLLSATGLTVFYGSVRAVEDVSFDVRPGEVVAILGANGAGKSSIIRAVVGLTPIRSGTIRLRGQRIEGLRSDGRVECGLAYVPEGRRVFGDLSIYENLLMGAYVVRDRAAIRRSLAEVYELFPILAERRDQIAATLSGGEQQMLAVARALMRSPDLLVLDEPSLGLAPVMVKVIYQTLRRIRERGVTLLLAEQSAHVALKVADRAYVLETGRVAFSGDADRLRDDPALREAYFGIRATAGDDA